MNRRGFLQACLVTATAPAIISSGILMPTKSRLILSESDLEETIKKIWEFTEDRSKLIAIQPTLLWPGIKAYWDRAYAVYVADFTELLHGQ